MTNFIDFLSGASITINLQQAIFFILISHLLLLLHDSLFDWLTLRSRGLTLICYDQASFYDLAEYLRDSESPEYQNAINYFVRTADLYSMPYWKRLFLSFRKPDTFTSGQEDD